MDGAGTLTVFTRIILPMCTPILATVGIFSAVNQWNSFQDTLIYMTDSKLYSLQYLLYTYINQASALANAAKANSANVAALASAATPTSIRMMFPSSWCCRSCSPSRSSSASSSRA